MMCGYASRNETLRDPNTNTTKHTHTPSAQRTDTFDDERAKVGMRVEHRSDSKGRDTCLSAKEG